MSRELRRVPANWDHPISERRSGNYGPQPIRDSSFEDAAAEWKKEFAEWENGVRPSCFCASESGHMEFWEYSGDPPDRKYYRPWKDEDATWYQVWETVTEGTPVTPPFETQQELIDYLVANGDFWDQSRRAEGISYMPCDPWTRKQAESFVLGTGWAPSMVVTGGGSEQSRNRRLNAWHKPGDLKH